MESWNGSKMELLMKELQEADLKSISSRREAHKLL